MKMSSVSSAPILVRGMGRLLAAVSGLATASGALGVSTVYTWTGAISNQYSNAVNWTPVGVPDVLGEAFVLNGGLANVTSSVTVDWFDLQGGTLNVPNGVFILLATQPPDGTNETGVAGGGVLNLNGTVSNTGLRLTSGVAGDKAIWGHGAPGAASIINMSAATGNQVTGAVGGMLLVNQGIIQGSGQVGVGALNIENAATGVIQSTNAGSTLTVASASGGVANAGVLRSSAGVLRLSGSSVTQSPGGVIELVGSDGNARVEINNSTVTGGTVRQTATGAGNFVDAINGSTLASTSLQGAMVRVPNGNTAYVTGENVLDAAASIVLNATASNTTLQPSSGATSVTLSGAGGVAMSNSGNNILRATATGQGMINNLGAGIVGAGQIANNSLVVTNQTLIEASGSAGLIIDPPTVGGFTNNGMLRAATGSTLTLTSGTVVNGNGTIVASGPGALVVTTNATIAGGTLSSNGGGEFRWQSGTEIQNATIAAGTIGRMPNAATLGLVGTIVHNGTLSIESTVSNTLVSTSGGDVTINGTGLITSSNSFNNFVTGSAGQRLTLNNTGGIVGAGQLGLNTLSVTNNTTIAAQGSAGLRIDPPQTGGFTNNGTVRSNAGSELAIWPGPFDNTEGVIQILSGGAGAINGASITGGTIQGPGVITNSGTSTLTDVTIASGGVVNITNGTSLQVAGAITLDGDINLSSTVSNTDLRTVGGDVVFNGSGRILMSSSTANLIRPTTAGERLTFNNAGGVRGSGQIGTNSGPITNNTTIAANGSAGLTVDPPATGGIDNNGVFVAESGSTLQILSGPFDNADGIIRVQPNASVTLQSVSVAGGTLEGAATGSFFAVSNPTLSGVLLDAAAVLRITNSNSMTIVDGIVNNGDIRVEATVSNTALVVGGNQTLTGTGTVTLSGANSRITGGAANQRLTIVGHTIRGTGNIGGDTLGITNRGSVVADVAGTLTVDMPSGAAFINDEGGLVHLSNGNMTVLAGGFTNAGGTIRVDAGRKLARSAADVFTQTSGQTVVNGEFEVNVNNFQLQGGVLAGSGNTSNNGWVDSNVTNTGGVISPGETAASGIGLLTIEGTLTQSGTGETRIEIAGAGVADKVVVTGAMNLGGILRVVLLEGYEMAVGDSFDVLVGATRNGDFDSIIVETLPFYLQFNVQMLSDRVRLIAAARCLGDYDLDGGVTGADIAAFFSDFEQGAENADLDQDGGITGADIAEFFTRFENGC